MGRGACYGARFRRHQGFLTRLGPDRALPPKRFLAQLPVSCQLVGEGASLLGGSGRFAPLPEAWNLPRAECVYEIARECWQSIRKGKASAPREFDDPHQLMPTYLRAPQAQVRSTPNREES